MPTISFEFNESNPNVNKGDREWVTYKWDYEHHKKWFKQWIKIPDPHFTQLDIEGSPLSQYRGEYMGMPIKEYLLLSIKEDIEMIELEREVFLKEFEEKRNVLYKELFGVKKTIK